VEVGTTLGTEDGSIDGLNVGNDVGVREGIVDGAEVGSMVAFTTGVLQFKPVKPSEHAHTPVVSQSPLTQTTSSQGSIEEI